jgi:hypothetical protein
MEETGAKFPNGHVAGNWISGGMYQGFVVVVPTEDSVEINTDHEDRHVLNPDDPDGDGIEVVAWWEIEDLPKNPAVRDEVKKGTDWKMLEDATTSTDDPEDHKADQKVALVRKIAGECPVGRFVVGTRCAPGMTRQGGVKHTSQEPSDAEYVAEQMRLEAAGRTHLRYVERFPLTSLIARQDDMQEVLDSNRRTDSPGEPIWVKARDDMPGKYEIADGHHRVADVIRAGGTHISADLDPDEDDEPYDPPFYDFSQHTKAEQS